MDPLLAGKVAVVTGGASGIGRGICRAFAEHGADVVVADVREEPREGGTPTHELIADETDARATFVECNVTEMADLEATVEAAEGLGAVDVLVNNAGILQMGDFFDVTPEAYDQLMGVNVRGMFFLSQLAGERMVEQGSGSIVNVSSVAGLVGNGDYVTYSTSKGAVRLLTYALAGALGPHGVRVNAIHPGAIKTAMTAGFDEALEAFKELVPLRRIGQPEDVAGAAVFLASDLAAYVSAASLVVDGGYTYTG